MIHQCLKTAYLKASTLSPLAVAIRCRSLCVLSRTWGSSWCKGRNWMEKAWRLSPALIEQLYKQTDACQIHTIAYCILYASVPYQFQLMSTEHWADQLAWLLPLFPTLGKYCLILDTILKATECSAACLGRGKSGVCTTLLHNSYSSNRAHDRHLVARIIKTCTDSRTDGNETKFHLKQNVFGQKLLLY